MESLLQRNIKQLEKLPKESVVETYDTDKEFEVSETIYIDRNQIFEELLNSSIKNATDIANYILATRKIESSK